MGWDVRAELLLVSSAELLHRHAGITVHGLQVLTPHARTHRQTHSEVDAERSHSCVVSTLSDKVDTGRERGGGRLIRMQTI